jgi:hypothetical protein
VSVDQEAIGVESVMARHTVARAIYVAPVLIGIFALIGGWAGAWSSALGVAVVVANFLLSGALLSVSARISLQVYHAAAMFGFFLRLLLVVGAVYLISVAFEVDRIAFGLTAIAAYVTVLVLEAVAVAKGKERELTWTN